MRICPKCKTEVNRNDGVCPNCGVRLINNSENIGVPKNIPTSNRPVTNFVPQNRQYNAVPIEPKDEKEGTKVAIIVAVVVAVVLAIVLVFVLASNSGNKRSADEDMLFNPADRLDSINVQVGDLDNYFNYNSSDNRGTVSVPDYNINASYDDEYIINDSDSSYVYRSDLFGMSEWELRVARNEIYARHGRKFKDEALQSYFEGKDWYFGYISPSSFNDDVLNEYEKANLKTILEYEKEMGYRD